MFKALKRILICLVAFLLTGLVVSQSAVSDDEVKKQIPLNQYGIRSPNPYVVNRFAVDGELIDEIIVPSRPRPPEGFIRQVAVIPEPDVAAGTNTILNVPALTWSFGCSATSAAMMFGHYDNAGYPNMYLGPTNGGVFPMTNATWGTVVINGETRALCPLSATRLGLDGRATKGHVDDYWIQYGSSLPDPFIGNWAEHTHGECTADYMGTNQSLLSSTDGSTTFYSYTNGAPLYDYTGSEPAKRDGCHGMRLFAESRGYTIDTNFSQYIYGYNGNTQGFTFNDFKAEIDTGRPVVIQVTGHSMLGYGYDDVGSTIYIHNTWDYNAHSMTWGGTYSGMTHYGVAVVRLSAGSPTTTTTTSTTTTSTTSTTTSTTTTVPTTTTTSTTTTPTTTSTTTTTVPTTTTTSTTTTTTLPAPTVITGSAGSVGKDSAILNGTVNPNGISTNCHFQYGRSVSYGFATSIISAGSVSNAVSVSAAVTGLEPGADYHFRIVGSNSAGTRYGNDQTFKTAYASVVFVHQNDNTCGGKNPCFTTIQDAVNTADTGAEIRVAGGTYAESFELNAPKLLTLSGRWNNGFTDQTGYATIIKAPKAPQGSLTLQMLTIKP